MAIPRLLKWALWALGTVIVLFITFCIFIGWLFSGFAGEPSKDEVARVVSQNGNLDAVLIETNGGATTSFGYEVYVLKHGAKPTGNPPVFLYGAVRSHSAYGANLRWMSPNILSIEYLSAKSKRIEEPIINIRGQRVELTLSEGVEDVAAPDGGMLYNLRKARENF